VALKDVILFMQGKSATVKVWCLIIQILVPRVMKSWLVEELPKGVYSFKVNKDVVKFVSENDGMIGLSV
jgi:phosphate transport system substrate-binding protein